MSKVLYNNVDLLLYEGSKHITINPRGERFYFVPCDEQSKIYRNATLYYDEETEHYTIKGEQSLYGEHKAMGRNYEKLLCLHPAELIVKKSFLGFTWYRVSGVLKREIRSHYLCEHNEYRIHERTAILSHTIEER